MSSAFSIIGSISILIAVVFHAYVFTLESLSWLQPKTWKIFGLPSQEHAEIIRLMAFNQGFYNLFLAFGAALGLSLLGVNSTVGLTLLFFAAGSMVCAGVVLYFSSKRSRRAAAIQAGPPLLGAICLLIGRGL